MLIEVGVGVLFKCLITTTIRKMKMKIEIEAPEIKKKL